MNNTVEICIKHGYSVNFYKLKDEVFVEVINREGVIVNNLRLTPEIKEALQNLMS